MQYYVGVDNHKKFSYLSVMDRKGVVIIEAVWPAIKKDLSLRELYESLKIRKGANKAKVAVARRLALIVHRVLSQRSPYVVNYSGCPHHFLAEAAV